jgi:predicted short-subunit dehydrogenase-like oxidoreductase (DUF2520 family)
MKSFSIIGAGRLGTSLGAALAGRGWRPVTVVDRDLGAARAGRRIIGGGTATTSFAAAAGARGTVIIAVPDAAVARAASGLARARGSWAGRVVFHTSGLLPAAVLAPLARRGALVASLHPAQSFPQKGMPAAGFEGITWGLEGDADAVEAAEGMVRDLGGHILLLAARDKALYHAACALASNAFVALEWTAVGLLGRVGLAPDAAADALLPLVQGTLQNVKSLGLEQALTGPVLRGDVATVEAHLKALGDDPVARRIYAALGKRILDLAARRGLPASRIRALKRRLAGK